MLKIGLIGFGFMGRMHFENYERLMKEGKEIQLVAVCDLKIETLKDSASWGNIATEQSIYDLSPYKLYESAEDMLANEQLDMIDLCLPTPLHADFACRMMEQGKHVLCEKPIALTSAEALRMAETSKKTGKKLMIGQCLRFWPAYELLKECVEDGRYGQVVSGNFFRGSGLPQSEWFLDGELSGGCMVDMHIHDTDVINWLFGAPEHVSSIARNVIPGSAYDTVATNYFYPDGKVINAQADWTLQGDFGFSMTFRVNFEKANLIMDAQGVKVNPIDAPGFMAELSSDMGYYRELNYFIDTIVNDTENTVCTPESAVKSLEIVEAEIRSANNKGALEKLA